MASVTISFRNETFYLGEIIVEVERYGQYQKPYRVVVVEAHPRFPDAAKGSLRHLGYEVGDNLTYFQGEWVGPREKDLEVWANTPPHPVCPCCRWGINLGYNYGGTSASCWARNDQGEIVTCWSGPVTALLEDPENQNPWVPSISYQGSF